MVLFEKFTIILELFMFIPFTDACDCDSLCRSRWNEGVCDSIEALRAVAESNTGMLLEWERYRPFVKTFSEKWKKEIAAIVETKLNEYIASGKLYPKPENLEIEAEGDTENDTIMISKPPEEDLVTNLIAKVEMVENRTIEVEEELKSERRVRRHLEQEVKETQSSLVFLGDQLQNVTVPVDVMMNQVQMVIYSSLEDMNKTIYEDHLKKLYYKVEGVVYKNETKKLDERLEYVETELHDDDNSSIVFKLLEDMKTLEENLYLLNNSVRDTLIPGIDSLNSSIGTVLVPRVETLENDVVRKDAVEELEDKMTTLLNNTELFRNALADVLLDIQDIRNLEKKFHNFSEEWAKSVEAIQNQLEHLKNETIMNRPVEPPDDIDDESNEIFQLKIIDRPEQNGTTENEEYITLAPVTPDIVNISSIFNNDTTKFDESVTWEPEVTPSVVSRVNISEMATEEYDEIITLEPDVTPDIVDRTRIGDALDEESELCEKPFIIDSHLLADIGTDVYGRKKLKFGCRPIGLYAVSHLPVPPRCENGLWKEPFPSCRILSNISKIESLENALQKYHPCSSGLGEFPDPFNCSQFFKCSHAKPKIIPCPVGLYFNVNLKVCDYPRTTPCNLVLNDYEKQLQTLIPPIHIEPDNLDKQNSLLGTGTSGELIVHPRSSFSLHCLYPESVWGLPTWNVTYTRSDASLRNLKFEEGKNGISLTVTAAVEMDSGIYRCQTPFGVQHAIEVKVRVVICPTFTLEDDYEDVFYRPTPEGEHRIMGTTAEFTCEEGHTIIALCMADGRWSRGIPSKGECTLKKRSNENTWSCKPFDLSKHPDLILERRESEKIITFKCAGRKRLSGNSFTRCRDDGVWSHTSLPRCKD